MNRRRFIQTSFATLGICASNTAMANGLGLLNNITQTTGSFTDYKSLICISLNGGADTISLFVPTGNTDYERYRSVRQNLSYNQASLLSINPINGSIGEIGLPSFMESGMELFEQGDLSIVANVGPLREPLTRDMILANEQILPPFLGSHNDQANLWQAGIANVNESTGWGGRMIEALNLNSIGVPSNISLNGTRKFLRSSSFEPFSVDTQGIQNLSHYVDYGSAEDTPTRAIFNQLVTNSQPNSLRSSYTRVVNSAMDNNQVLASLLNDVSPRMVEYNRQTEFRAAEHPINELVEQLQRAAELVELAPQLGHHRQVIYIQMNAFDTHDNQQDTFPGLMKGLMDNLKIFQQDLVARGVDDRVVALTQSEFGRTISINSNGTDHGWGGHQFVMGTPVKGGQVIGALPEFEIGSSNIYQNSFIPQYSVEQYAGNLAKWFGISSSQILDVFPNYNRFDDLDFGLFN